LQLTVGFGPKPGGQSLTFEHAIPVLDVPFSTYLQSFLLTAILGSLLFEDASSPHPTVTSARKADKEIVFKIPKFIDMILIQLVNAHIHCDCDSIYQ
jgi:hypothetical protein